MGLAGYGRDEVLFGASMLLLLVLAFWESGVGREVDPSWASLLIIAAVLVVFLLYASQHSVLFHGFSTPTAAEE